MIGGSVHEAAEAALLEQACGWCLKLSEGRLAPAESAAFELWLDDADHQRAFNDAARAWRAVELAADTPELIGMRAAALNRFRRGQRRRWTTQLRSRVGVVATTVAAAVVLFVCAAAWMTYRPISYQTGVGERRVIALPDGSQISLDAATKVSVRYTARNRDIRLESGRAKFTVAKNPSRPFAVTAATRTVIATGTEFSVELLKGQVEVILYKGQVAVLEKPDAGARRWRTRFVDGAAPTAQILTPGRELVASLASPAVQILAADPARSLQWEAGQLVFVDEPLASAVERVNRYSDDKLAVGDSAAGALLISGTFAEGDTGAFVEGVTGVFPVRVSDVDGHKVLTSTR